MCLLHGLLLCSGNTCLEAEITNYMHDLNLSKYIKLNRNYLTANQHFEHIVCLLSMCISGPYGEGEQVLGVWGKPLQNTADWVQFDPRGQFSTNQVISYFGALWVLHMIQKHFCCQLHSGLFIICSDTCVIQL